MPTATLACAGPTAFIVPPPQPHSKPIEVAMPHFRNIAFVASETEEAQAALRDLIARYGNVPPEQADIIVALGGDGLMLQTMHRHMNSRIPIYGMNRGSVGFLLNDYHEDQLLERLQAAETTIIHPLLMVAYDCQGAEHRALAINEVSLFRQIYQSAKLRIAVDGRVRLDEPSATACSSRPRPEAPLTISPPTARFCRSTRRFWCSHRSARFGPGAGAARFCPKRPRSGSRCSASDKRPVSAVADNTEFRDVIAVEVKEASDIDILMMFDPGHTLAERILREQFGY